jgi:two-component system response regulator PilR (NtrC family)
VNEARHLLIVDDEVQVVEALRDYFRTIGYEVDSAESLGEARAFLFQGRYDAVVTDLRLSAGSQLDGLEVIGCLRSKCRRTACIVLTAYGGAASQLDAYARGADAYLQKPTPLPAVAATIVEVLARGRSRACG